MTEMNVGEAISPAISHTARVLFKPFALRKWLGLGFVSLVAAMGEGGFHVNTNFGDERYERVIGEWIVHHVALVLAFVALLFLVGIALSWIGSVMRFVYLSQITRDPYAIREPFRRLIRIGTSFFLWKLAFGLIVALAFVALIALPIAGLYLSHLTRDVGAIVAVVIWCVLLGLPLLVIATVVDLFARDFAATAMFVRNVGVIEGWRVVMPILRENAGQCALYVLLVIAIALVVGMASLFVLLAVGTVFAVVCGVFGLIGYGIYAAEGHMWSTTLIAYAIVLGTILFVAFTYAMSCASQPFYVFRRTFSLVVVGQADPSLTTVPEEHPLQERYVPPSPDSQ